MEHIEQSTQLSEWISTTEASNILDVTKRWITTLIARDKLKAQRVGDKVWLIDRQSVFEYDRQRKRNR